MLSRTGIENADEIRGAQETRTEVNILSYNINLSHTTSNAIYNMPLSTRKHLYSPTKPVKET